MLKHFNSHSLNKLFLIFFRLTNGSFTNTKEKEADKLLSNLYYRLAQVPVTEEDLKTGKEILIGLEKKFYASTAEKSLYDRVKDLSNEDSCDRDFQLKRRINTFYSL